MSTSKSSWGDTETYRSGKSIGFVSDDEDSWVLNGSSVPFILLSSILILFDTALKPKEFGVWT